MNLRVSHRSLCAAFALLLSACSSLSERKLDAEFDTWKGVPYLETGTTRAGISNAAFVREMFHNSFGVDVPITRDEQFRAGKLVERKDLQAGDIVFFEGAGFGPFRTRAVAIYMGRGKVAMAKRETGVSLVKLKDAPWNTTFKTARRINLDTTAGTPTFDVAKYGSNTAALLRDIAIAWTGTLYLDNGTTFDGIGNYEYVRAVYEGVYDAELEGTPQNWLNMGEAVSRDSLKPGDIILYKAIGIGGAFNRSHAGIYIGDGEFTHCMKGAAVTISKLDDPKWAQAYRTARRIDPDVQNRLVVARTNTKSTKPTTGGKKSGGAAGTNKGADTSTVSDKVVPIPVAVTPPHDMNDVERKLRAVTESWRGTPYKIGGTSKKGVDCSAFVRAAYKEGLSVDLPRTSAEQELLGVSVNRSELKSGDLVFFRTQGMGPFFKSRHVGVYLGAGEFAQSSGSKGVTISRLDQYYWNKKYHGARRISGGG